MAEKCLVSNIQRYSTNDGPGIRSLVILMGCNMKCFWCHNPETLSGKNVIYWRAVSCVQCGLCLESCPRDAIRPPIPVEESRMEGSTYYKIDKSKCDNCMKCVEACHFGALEPAAKLMTTGDVIDEVMRDELFYKNSGGGMTIGGGEPTVHPRFLMELLKKGKEKGLHICLDTNGAASWKIYEETLPYVDIYLVDIKNMDSEIHRRGTGVGNEDVLESIRRLSAAGATIYARVPVIYDFNDFDENFDKIGKFLKSLPNPVAEVDLLPFHNYCQNKYRWLGIDWPLEEEEAMENIECEEFKEIIETYVDKCTIGG